MKKTGNIPYLNYNRIITLKQKFFKNVLRGSFTYYVTFLRGRDFVTIQRKKFLYKKFVKKGEGGGGVVKKGSSYKRDIISE